MFCSRHSHSLIDVNRNEINADKSAAVDLICIRMQIFNYYYYYLSAIASTFVSNQFVVIVYCRWSWRTHRMHIYSKRNETENYTLFHFLFISFIFCLFFFFALCANNLRFRSVLNFSQPPHINDNNTHMMIHSTETNDIVNRHNSHYCDCAQEVTATNFGFDTSVLLFF